MKKSFFLLALFSLLVTQMAWTQEAIVIKGVAINSQGIPLPDGRKDITLNVYTSHKGGTPLWSEEQSITVKDGQFSTTLSKSTTSDLAPDKQYWLGMKVGDGEELSSRIPLENEVGILAVATLDDAYDGDGGGAGSGRTITADAGAVNIEGPDGLTVEGDVGVGTTTPTGKLHVFAATGNLNLKVESAGVDSKVGLRFINDVRNWRLFVDGPLGDIFGIRDVTAGVDRFSINTSGDVGVGTVTPTARLTVRSDAGTNLIEAYNDGAGAAGLVFRVERATGNVHAEGSFNGGGADVAEYVNMTESVEPGDVIEIDPNESGKFRKARESKSRRVAGIITTEPGVILGSNSVNSQDLADHPAVALAGRVPVKVMAKYGAIAIGDLLVSSPFPGYAMKCDNPNECIGAIIGKAMEPMEQGTGKIMVQVMLR